MVVSSLKTSRTVNSLAIRVLLAPTCAPQGFFDQLGANVADVGRIG